MYLAERGGFAYMLQAAESLASDSLRIPRVSRAGGLLLSAKTKKPAWRAFVFWRERGILIKPYNSIVTIKIKNISIKIPL